jgi:hypothetical protein
LMVVPSSIVDSMNLGGLIGMAAARHQLHIPNVSEASVGNGPVG